MAKSEKQDPVPHQQYLDTLSRAHDYRDDLKEALKEIKLKKGKDGKVDIGDLIDQILEKSGAPAKKHFPGQDHHVKLPYDLIREILDNAQIQAKLNKNGLDDEVIGQLSGRYLAEAQNYGLDTYMSQLQQMKIEDARKSVKEIAGWHGRDDHFQHIDKTTRHTTLANRVRSMYHEENQNRVGERHPLGQYDKSKGYHDYIGWKPPAPGGK
ncbi:MAG: hypothetical protein ABH879_10615 [archaeon]